MAFNRWNNDVIPEGLKRKKIPTNSFFFFIKKFFFLEMKYFLLQCYSGLYLKKNRYFLYGGSMG